MRRLKLNQLLPLVTDGCCFFEGVEAKAAKFNNHTCTCQVNKIVIL